MWQREITAIALFLAIFLTACLDSGGEGDRIAADAVSTSTSTSGPSSSDPEGPTTAESSSTVVSETDSSSSGTIAPHRSTSASAGTSASTRSQSTMTTATTSGSTGSTTTIESTRTGRGAVTSEQTTTTAAPELPRQQFFVDYHQDGASPVRIDCSDGCTIETAWRVNASFSTASGTPVTVENPCYEAESGLPSIDRVDRCAVSLSTPRSDSHRSSTATMIVKWVPQSTITWTVASPENAELNEEVTVTVDVSIRHNVAPVYGIHFLVNTETDLEVVGTTEQYLVTEPGSYDYKVKVTGCNPTMTFSVSSGGPVSTGGNGVPSVSWGVNGCA